MNHVLTYPEDYYYNFINDNVSVEWRDRLKNFFNRSDAKQFLSENDFDNLYNCFYNNVDYGVESDLTRILLAADIDFLIYLKIVPFCCFEGMAKIDKIIIPKNIKIVHESSFFDLSPDTEVSYEGTVSELTKLIDDSSFIFKKQFVPKVICSDGEVEIK